MHRLIYPTFLAFLITTLPFVDQALAQDANQQTYAPYSSFTTPEAVVNYQGQVLAAQDEETPSYDSDYGSFERQTYTPFSSFRNQAGEVHEALKLQSKAKHGFIKPYSIYVELVHERYMGDDMFGLQFSLKDSLSGCYKHSPLKYEARFMEPYFLDIKVHDYRRTSVVVERADFECDLQTQKVGSMIVLNRKELKKRGVKQIRFNNGYITDHYDVKITPNTIALYPDSTIAFKALGLVGPKKNKMVHHYLSDNILALQVPMARDNEDIELHVRNLAYQYDLRPIFDNPALDNTGKDNIFFFTDPSGASVEKLADAAYMELGEIAVNRPYQGGNGLISYPVSLKVFATQPETKL